MNKSPYVADYAENKSGFSLRGASALFKRGYNLRKRLGEGGEYGQGGKRRYKFTRGCEHSVAKEEQEGEQISYHEGRN